MTLTKSAMTITSLATAMLFGGGLYLFMNLGSIAKTVTEDYAARTLGVDVTIGRMDVSLQNRTVDVSNIRIHNPDGYKGVHAVVVDSVTVQAGSLGSELLEFKTVDVSGANVYLEITPSGVNLTDIRKNLNEKVGAKPSEGEKAVKVILDKLILNGTVHTDITFLDKTYDPFALPPIHLSDIGRSENGVLVGAAISEVWKVISRETIRSANKYGFLAGLDVNILKEGGMSDVTIVKDNIDHQVDKIKNSIKGLLE